jgi:Tol biopolymer transport system component
MQIWRMKSDGAGREQMTRDERNNWNPHPSPDGKSVVFLSYEPDVKDVSANQDVILRRLTLADGKIDDLAKIFGGPGTIDSPSWSPDSRKLAFVSRQFAP